MQSLEANRSLAQIVFLVILHCLLLADVEGQSPHFHVKEFAGQNIRSNFNCIFEDDLGRMYFGSNDGLFFFDGQKMHKIPVKGDSIIQVSAIYETFDDVLLIGSEKGIIYQLIGGRLSQLKLGFDFPKTKIVGFCQDDSNRLWCATYGQGVYIYDSNQTYHLDEKSGLLGNDLYEITALRNGEIWLATDGGINICSIEKDDKTIRSLTRKDGLPDDIIRAIQQDENGNVWIGMYDHGFCRYNLDKAVVDFKSKEWAGGIVNCIEIFEGRELWIGTDRNGIYRYDLNKKVLSQLNNINDFSKSTIIDLEKDSEGNIWVLDNLHKLSVANNKFEKLDLPIDNIQAILVDKEQKIWFGVEEGLFTWQQDGSKYFKQVLKEKNLNVTSLFQDKYGNMWVGTFGDGVYIYQESTAGIIHFSEKEGLTNNSVLSIDGVNGHVWLATLGGVTEVELTDNPILIKEFETRNFNQANGLGSNFIYTVFIDSKQRVWFGTDGKGLSVLADGELKNYKEIVVVGEEKSDTTIIKTIYSISEDQQGHIWFSSSKKGVFVYDGQNFSKLALKKEFNQHAVNSIISTDGDEVLLIYPFGVAVLDSKSKHLIYYDHEVGLDKIDPNLNVSSLDENGNIWFADQSQLIKYRPLQEKLEIDPRTIITDVKVNYQSFNFSGHASLPHDHNNIVFKYLGLWYTAPEKVKYKYRLKGYDLDWIYSKDNQVSYSNLRPGDYTFELTSTENESFEKEEVISFNYTITKPIWKRSWFIALCILFGSAAVYYFIKLRDKRKQRDNEMQKENLSNQLAALKAQINPHFLFNSFNTLSTLIDENQEAAVEYVERLSDFYRSMLQYRDVEVIPVQEELELVKVYAFLLKKRFGKNFQIDFNVENIQAYLAPLSLQILVENAVKHNVISKSKPLKVSIDLEDDNYITVSNNIQRKLNLEPSTNFGLQSLKRRYELIGNNKLRIEETKNNFRVSLPLIQ